MAQLAVDEHGADWVIVSEADEFRDATWESIKDILVAIPPRYGIVQSLARVFLPCPDDGRPSPTDDRSPTVLERPERTSRWAELDWACPIHRAAPNTVIGEDRDAPLDGRVPLRAVSGRGAAFPAPGPGTGRATSRRAVRTSGRPLEDRARTSRRGRCAECCVPRRADLLVDAEEPGRRESDGLVVLDERLRDALRRLGSAAAGDGRGLGALAFPADGSGHLGSALPDRRRRRRLRGRVRGGARGRLRAAAGPHRRARGENHRSRGALLASSATTALPDRPAIAHGCSRPCRRRDEPRGRRLVLALPGPYSEEPNAAQSADGGAPRRPGRRGRLRAGPHFGGRSRQGLFSSRGIPWHDAHRPTGMGGASRKPGSSARSWSGDSGQIRPDVLFPYTSRPNVLVRLDLARHGRSLASLGPAGRGRRHEVRASGHLSSRSSGLRCSSPTPKLRGLFSSPSWGRQHDRVGVVLAGGRAHATSRRFRATCRACPTRSRRESTRL